MQKLLKFVRKLIRLHRANPVKHRLIAGKIGVFGVHRRKRLFTQPVQFEREKHQRRGVIGHLFLAIGHEFRPPAINRKLVIAQPGKGHDPPGNIAYLFVAMQTFQKAGRIKIGQFALVISSEFGAGGFKPVEITLEFGRVFAAVEIAQVPFGQLSQILVAGTGICVADGERQIEHEAPLADC